MKKIILLITFYFFYSCKEKNEVSVSKDESRDMKLSTTIDCSSEFEIFFRKFSQDSIFQKNSVKFPLIKLSYDYETSEKPVISYLKSSKNYNYTNFSKDSEAMEKEYDKYQIEKIRTKNGLIYKRIGYDNGIHISYEFQIIEGCWYLVKIIDEST